MISVSGGPFHENSTGWHGLLKRWNENGAVLMDERLSVCAELG